jgi:hypothetical protein
MQVSGVEAPTIVEYFPAAQLMQVPGVEAPTIVEYFPALQGVHASDESYVSLYVPTGHRKHCSRPSRVPK